MDEDTEPLIALIYSRGLEAGMDLQRSRLDCHFCDDRLDLCKAWLTGFSVGRLANVKTGRINAEDRSDAGGRRMHRQRE